MNASKLFTILGLGASFVALAYPEAPTNHAADSTASIVAPAVEPLVVDPVTNVSPALITAVSNPTVKPIETLTDGPTPLTEEEFADLQKWVRAGKPIQEWVDNHPDPATKRPAASLQSPVSQGHNPQEIDRMRSELFDARAKIAEQAAEINDLREQIRRLAVVHPPTPVQEPKPNQAPTKPIQAQADNPNYVYYNNGNGNGGGRRFRPFRRGGGGGCGLFGCR